MSLSMSQKDNGAQQRLPDAQMGWSRSPLLHVVCDEPHTPLAAAIAGYHEPRLPLAQVFLSLVIGFSSIKDS